MSSHYHHAATPRGAVDNTITAQHTDLVQFVSFLSRFANTPQPDSVQFSHYATMPHPDPAQFANFLRDEIAKKTNTLAVYKYKRAAKLQAKVAKASNQI